MPDFVQFPISDDPETCQFIASSLSAFMASERPNRGQWSIRRVADYITGSEDIEGTLSATTLGRFLDPASKQMPSSETVHMVAAFLIRHRWIDPADIELMGKSSRLRQMSELAAFFGMNASASQTAFLHDLAGSYAGIHAAGRYVGLHRFSLRCEPGIPALIVRETFRTFDLGRSGASWLPENPALSDFFQLPFLIRNTGGRSLASIKNGGVMIAGPGIAVALMRPEPIGFESVVALKAIAFDGDHVSNLEGGRALGWKQIERGGFVRPESPQDAQNEMARAKLLSASVDLLKFPYLQQRKKILAEFTSEDVNKEDNLKYFLSMRPVQPENNAAEIADRLLKQYESAVTPNMGLTERLRLAYEHRVLPKFRELLQGGADPNVPHPDTGLPVIFQVAAAGEPEWLDALLECDRLNLTVRDNQGMPPSFHAGVAAREAVAEGNQDEADTFGMMFHRLHAEEAKQAAPAPRLKR